jgi:hypothetical protein
MKNLSKFLTERKEEKRPLRKNEGKDDQLYIDLMGYYKHVARKSMDKDEANKYLSKAQELSRNGDVSENAKLGGAYI